MLSLWLSQLHFFLIRCQYYPIIFIQQKPSKSHIHHCHSAFQKESISGVVGFGSTSERSLGFPEEFAIRQLQLLPTCMVATQVDPFQWIHRVFGWRRKVHEFHRLRIRIQEVPWDFIWFYCKNILHFKYVFMFTNIMYIRHMYSYYFCRSSVVWVRFSYLFLKTPPLGSLDTRSKPQTCPPPGQDTSTYRFCKPKDATPTWDK